MVSKSVLHRRNILLVLLLLVLGANTALYHTTYGTNILPENSNGVVVGSIIDLAFISPLLFIAWKQNWNVKNIIVAIASGLILVRFLIPIEYLQPFETVTWLGFVVEGLIVLFEVFLILILIKFLPKIIHSVKKSSLPVVFSFPDAVDQHIKATPLIKIICTEFLIFYYAFLSWKKKPISNHHTFTLYKNSSLIATQIMLIHSIVLETLVIHWWIHENFFVLSIILLVLNIYSIIFLIGNLQAIRHNALHITEEKLYVSFGIFKQMQINWSNIDKVIDEPDRLRQKHPKNTIEFIARDFEDAYPHVILKLKQPTIATLLLGRKKEYKFVAIRVDELNRFKKVLNEYLVDEV